ncbi:cytochrome P450 [Halorhabdus sp. BNX81]|uniref:cytochrome P450 n=1 Tax=Halorhabdus sp. BNX81 TaxID=2980181 RepID=UPI0023DD5D8B|nr:cytochrome P450 [Halorhabdus sp. BNX81]WEL20913.1 Cytochrome P450 [Halorhabdus sp. BNX81]
MAETQGSSTERGEQPSETPPGPGGLPLLGNTLDLYRDPWALYEELESYGDVVHYTAGGNDFNVVLDPTLVEQVLLTDHDAYGKWALGDVGGGIGSEGLVLTEGEQWQRQRRVIQEAFTMDRIRAYGDAMGQYAAEAVETWDDGEEIALNEAFSRLTLRILAHSLFDLDIDAEAGTVAEFTRTVNDRMDVDNLTAFVPLWVPLPRNRRFKRRVAAFESFVEELIEQRRADATERDDLLSLLLAHEGDGLTETEIRDQMTTFLFAGHETTSLALTYACMALATHPGPRERLDREYERVLDGEIPDLAQVPQLEATERAIKEALRLYPPVYVLFREANRDVELGGYRVPSGQKITVPQFWIHRKEAFYDDPDEFDPSRWTDGFEDELHDYAYFPFGGGPRHCIGMRFAMQELKTVLPTVLQRADFELLLDPDPEFSMGATLRPAEDVRVRVRKRS